MTQLTTPLESATRVKIDHILQNLGWNLDEFNKDCNVFTERVRTENEKAKIRAKYPTGRFPDYVLYSNDVPVAIIEAKRVGVSLDKALVQAKEYAECIEAPIIFAVDGGIVEARWIDGNKYLRRDGQLITDLLSEKELIRFVDDGPEIYAPQKVTKTKEDLIDIFEKTNELLRQEGMREGIERFTEFSNLLFLKLIDEIEKDRDERGEPRRIEANYTWSAFNQKKPQEMLDYINDTVLPKLVDKYNHSGDVFNRNLAIKNPNILKQIVDELSELTLLDVDSDVKGDAFEYFLKNSVTVGNDLGEYYTPRHVVKLVVDLVDPKFGDKVYDPCCGTGGFLIEAFRHIARTCRPTKENLQRLEQGTIYAGELTATAKIAKMNMILAGDGHTDIAQQDSLANPKKDEYEVIVTNFPFSQKTDYAHLYGLSTTQANAVFLKHVIDALKPGGTAGVVVPDSVLFAKDTDTIKVRRELVERCNIRAVVQLDVNVFAPYTKQPTSIVIFDKVAPTKDIWFFEVNDDGFSKSFKANKRKPIDKNDIPLLRTLWNDRADSERSFTLSAERINKDVYKLFLNFYKSYERVQNPVELGAICKEFVLGSTPSTKNNAYYGGKNVWVTIADMNQKYLNDSKQKLSDLGAAQATQRRLVRKGGLLMSFKLTLGRTAFADTDLYTNEAICELRLKPEYDDEETREYLYHILPHINYMPYAQRAAKGFTLNKDLLPTVEIPFPDKVTRAKFVKMVKAIEEENIAMQKQLLKNREKYKSLIATDITGK